MHRPTMRTQPKMTYPPMSTMVGLITPARIPNYWVHYTQLIHLPRFMAMSRWCGQSRTDPASNRNAAQLEHALHHLTGITRRVVNAPSDQFANGVVDGDVPANRDFDVIALHPAGADPEAFARTGAAR